MQEKEKKFLDLSEGIDAFKAKVKLWMHRMENGKLAAFPVLNLFVEEKNIDLCSISRIFFEHLNAFVQGRVKRSPNPPAGGAQRRIGAHSFSRK